jgi:deazaflavin-dependent oxidoreductase (nitroreductase family)
MAAPSVVSGRRPLFGGFVGRVAGRTKALTLPFAGKRWNPVFAVVVHRGRRSGRVYSTPVGARRVRDGFVISLAFGAEVDWYRNLLAAGGGTIRWRGRDYRVSAPQPIDASSAIRAFNTVQRLAIRAARISGFINVADEADVDAAK